MGEEVVPLQRRSQAPGATLQASAPGTMRKSAYANGPTGGAYCLNGGRTVAARMFLDASGAPIVDFSTTDRFCYNSPRWTTPIAGWKTVGLLNTPRRRRIACASCNRAGQCRLLSSSSDEHAHHARLSRKDRLSHEEPKFNTRMPRVSIRVCRLVLPGPRPVTDLFLVDTFGVCVGKMLDDLSVQPFLHVIADAMQARDAIDHVDRQRETVDLINNC